MYAIDPSPIERDLVIDFIRLFIQGLVKTFYPNMMTISWDVYKQDEYDWGGTYLSDYTPDMLVLLIDFVSHRSRYAVQCLC